MISDRDAYFVHKPGYPASRSKLHGMCVKLILLLFLIRFVDALPRMSWASENISDFPVTKKNATVVVLIHGCGYEYLSMIAASCESPKTNGANAPKLCRCPSRHDWRQHRQTNMHVAVPTQA
jgi:hypothetical protein